MKIQAFALCGVLLTLPAFGEGDKNRNENQKRFGDGTCLPQYLNQYDVDGNGAIDAEEAHVMKQARAQIRKKLRTDWDQDGDGQISDQERDRARDQLRQMIEDCRAERFEAADLDGDGVLTLTEPWVASEFGQLPGMQNKLTDDNPDNDAIVETIFNKLDADGDGGITLTEFLAVLGQCGADPQGDGPNRPDSPLPN